MKKVVGALIYTLIFSFGAAAQKSEVFNTSDGAIHGYDPVAYFKENKAVKGDKQYSVSWNTGTWYFLNQKNLELFTADPLLYAPQYGGFCAYGASQNHLSPTDPGAWTIINGKLYLNYSQDVKKLWLKDTSGCIKAANAYWSGLYK